MCTLEKYSSVVRIHLIPAVGKIELSALNKIQVQYACA